MPFFKSTYNILKRPDEDEVFNPNWMDSNTLVLPPKTDWTYDREMRIEDVDIWEVLYEASGGIGVYAAWCPYAEFYMMTIGWYPLRPGQQINDRKIEVYYGSNAQVDMFNRARQLGIPLNVKKVWVENDDMWLYPNQLHPNQSFDS